MNRNPRASRAPRRRLEVGAEVVDGEGVHFRVWAPGRRSVEVVIEGGPGASGHAPLRPSAGGFVEGLVPGAGVGTRYRYRLDGEGPYPDPASRFQPEGPHGPSEVVDPGSFAWSDAGWAGRGLEGAVIYEIHVGTFTAGGTWDSAIEQLPRLAKLGATVIEVMPVADFPGRFGWGYDGVNPYAPSRLYGEPDAMRRFVNRAHAEGLAVILDVNDNHLGPDGNFLARFAPAYFSDRYQTEWGRALNFDGDDSGPVRSFILGNAAYWIDEFHLDGLRIDATQSLFDTSEEHIIAAIARRVREAAGGRRTLVVGENEPQDSRMIRPLAEGGFGLDAAWVNDFHHAAMVAATGRREGYYADYRGTPQEFVSACRRGFLWQGQWDARQGKRRGSSTAGVDRSRFIFYLQNHDQVANSSRGERLHQVTSPGHYRALTALLLLGSGTPYLFQGQEFAASSPFRYFGDLEPGVAEEMHRGRRQFLKQFASLATPEMQAKVPRPHDPLEFAASKLDHSECRSGRHAEAYALHEDLLTLRHDHAPFRSGAVDGATIGPESFALRFSGGGDERLLLVNLGADLRLDPPAEPLLAPPSVSLGWSPLWSSEDPRYGGGGVPPIAFEGNDAWEIPARSATVLAPRLWDRRSEHLKFQIGNLRLRISGGTATAMNQPIRIISPSVHEPSPPPEWLVTNGLGGYASGTVAGFATRRYHGLLIAALPSPLGRTMMLNDCLERLGLPDGSAVTLGVEHQPAGPLEPGAGHLAEFRLEAGLPVWRHEVGGLALEKRLVMSHRQNTTRVTYRLLEGRGAATLTLRPAVHFRGHDQAVDFVHPDRYALTASGDRYELSGGRDLPALRLTLVGRPSAFQLDAMASPKVNFPIEASRGYESTGNRWSAGFFRVELAPGESATLVASTEPWEVIEGLDPGEASRCEAERRTRLVSMLGRHAADPVAAELALAADQFLIAPAGRVEDTARAHASGEEVRTVIAGYHWFTDWGRDTMISLEGLTLCTGRVAEAGYILRTFAYYIRDGLIPNMFPEGGKGGLYHTADATLWFFHAVNRYLAASGDRETLGFLVPKLLDIVNHHLRGTRFGIGVDPADGLLRQGQEGYQLTWMDAKVDGWVVTPRRGKAVEINALWYNALMLLNGWLDELGREADARAILGHAEEARASFNKRFWHEAGGHLYDVVDAEGGGDDPACRPNQLFAIALDHPVLDRSRWEAVVATCRERLLTPVGLRSLAPGHPDYKPSYHGDLRARDAAYHQGTAWSWLIGPLVDAWLKLRPDDRAGARAMLRGLVAHLDDAGVGSISEVFDAEAPYTPRGCIAQAWGLAELLRCWVKTA